MSGEKVGWGWFFDSVTGWALRRKKFTFPDDPDPGCGYGPFKTGAWDPFYMPCYIHDRDFGERSLSLEETERRFIRNVRRVILAARGPRRAVYWFWGYSYIGLVKLIGPSIFKEDSSCEK